MRILTSGLVALILSIILSPLSYAVCDVSSTASAWQYLRECSEWAESSISTTIGWDGVTSVKNLVISISKRVIGFGALFAIGAIVFSGIQYTTSYGEDEKVKKAKTTAIYALIGLVLLLVAFPMVDVIIGFVYRLGQ